MATKGPGRGESKRDANKAAEEPLSLASVTARKMNKLKLVPAEACQEDLKQTCGLFAGMT